VLDDAGAVMLRVEDTTGGGCKVTGICGRCSSTASIAIPARGDDALAVDTALMELIGFTYAELLVLESGEPDMARLAGLKFRLESVVFVALGNYLVRRASRVC